MNKILAALAKNPAKLSGVLALSAILLFFLACATPAILYVNDYGEAGSMSGGELLGQGWVAPVWVHGENGSDIPLVVGWYANPFFLLALIMLLVRKWKSTFVFGLLALAIGLTSFSLHTAVYGLDSIAYLLNIRLGIGAYLWLSSMLVVVLGAALGYGLRHLLLSDTE